VLENAAFYHDLEKRVTERTRELHETNAKLESAYEELKQAQSLILHSEKMASLGKLVAGIAHEINNPLGILSGNVEFVDMDVKKLMTSLNEFQKQPGSNPAALARMKLLTEDISSCLTPSKRSMQRIKNIVQDLRNFSRLDDAELTPADLNRELETVLQFFKIQTEARIDIHLNLNPLPPVTCYPAHLNQALSSVISNAIEAIEGEGVIDINTYASEANVKLPAPHVVIEVKDSGQGIPPEILGKIFDPFFTTKEVGKGKGLGLSITFGIIKHHRGVIEVESELGKGTSVTIRIPTNFDELSKEEE